MFQKLASKLGPIIFLKCRQKDKVQPVTKSNNHDRRITCADIDLHSEKSRFESDEESQSSSNDDESVTWQQISEISDRLCLYIYSVAVVLGLLLFCLDIEGRL